MNLWGIEKEDKDTKEKNKNRQEYEYMYAHLVGFRVGRREKFQVSSLRWK